MRVGQRGSSRGGQEAAERVGPWTAAASKQASKAGSRSKAAAGWPTDDVHCVAGLLTRYQYMGASRSRPPTCRPPTSDDGVSAMSRAEQETPSPPARPRYTRRHHLNGKRVQASEEGKKAQSTAPTPVPSILPSLECCYAVPSPLDAQPPPLLNAARPEPCKKKNIPCSSSL